MNNKINDSYSYIINYIKNNKLNLKKQELNFLLNYASILKEKNLENATEVDIKILIDDLSNLNNNIKSGELTSISFHRLERELKLFDAILNSGDLDEISYELDKLYIENDMGVRKNSTLSKKLYLNNIKKVQK